MPTPNLRLPILLAVGAAAITIGMKSLAYALTGSVGLFADALESVVNLLAAITAYVSLWYSARPIDPTHTYGHEKIEFFSSGLEGVLIIIAGFGTCWFAGHHLINPDPLASLGLGSAIALAASGVNLAVGIVLLRVGKKYRSPVLIADGQHLLTDVWTSVGVVAGLGLVIATGIAELDAIVAMAVGIHILVIGARLVRLSFDGLMDHALPAVEREALRAAIAAAIPAGATFHHLRTRLAGRRKFADFHLLVDGGLSVRAAHALAHQVEADVHAAIPDLEISIHIEPIDEADSWEAAQLAALGEGATPPIDP